MIKVENITKSFIVSGVKNHLKAVNNVSLEVKKGEIVCLIGPSGSGKSTLLRCIEGLEVPEKGNIYINDELLEEDYGREVIEDPGIAEDGITLGADEYFVLGDNRNNSSDSRDPDVGAVSKSQIRGHVWLRLRPDFGLIK